MPRKKREPLEKEIEKVILEWLYRQCPTGIFWKNHSIGTYDRNKNTFRRTSKYAINGVSDILGTYCGRFIAIEVKRPSCRNRVSKSQKSFIDDITRCGGLAFVACSIEDVENEFKKEGYL